MADVRRLIAGIVLVGIGIATVLGGTGGIVLYVGAILGVVGSGIVVYVLTRGNF